MKSRKAIAAATLLTLGLGMAGCGSFEGEATGESDGSKTLTIALQFPPVAGYATETDDAFILTQLGCLETLVRYNYETAELEPVLATEWKQTKPTQWDFTLRSGVKFQDGTDLNADAVVTALTHLLEAETPPRSFGPSTIAKVEAVDASTVRITTPTASALVPNRMATTWTGILAPAAYEGDGVDPMKNCTGPYTPVSEAAGQSITLEANSTYWGGAPGLDRVEGRFLGEGATRATQVQTGESQIALAIPPASQVEIEKNPDLKLVKAITPRTAGLYLNHDREPFSSVEARKAVQAALDLTAIATSVYGGNAEPAIGPFAPEEPWAPDGTPVTQDLDQAKKLLSAAGVEQGSTLTLLSYTERPEFADLSVVIQSSLKELGITVKIESAASAVIEPRQLAGDYDMSLLSRNHLVDIPDPLGFLTADYTCEGSYNISQYCDKAIDALVAKAAETADTDARYAIYGEIATKLQNEAVTVFMVHQQTTAAHSTKVQGFTLDPLARYIVTKDTTIS